MEVEGETALNFGDDVVRAKNPSKKKKKSSKSKSKAH